MVKGHRQRIRELSAWKVPDKTPEIINAAVQNELYETKATGSQTEPIPTQPVIT